MKSLLSAQNLTKRFGGLAAVNDVSLDLLRNHIHAVIGPNGAGKSTLTNLLSGDLPPTSGTVQLGGQDVTGWNPEKISRQGLGRSYQKTNIFLPFTVWENVRLAAQSRQPHAARWLSRATDFAALNARATRAIELSGLENRKTAIAGTISHGEQRQLEIAMTLATEPQVLLLDEPLAGMGVAEAERMVALLLDAQERPRHPAGRTRHGRGLHAGRPADRDGQRQGDRQRHTRRHPRRRRRAGRLSGRGTLMAELLIDAKGIHTYYGASHILRGIDFSVARGETIGLMGRNGMGKSTLLKSIMGLVRPRSGSVAITGQDMLGRAPYEISRLGIAYVPEGRGIFGNLSVVENLKMAARAGTRGQRDWTYERVLETFPRLQERLGHGGQQLSGGEQQMLTIGRALMTNPDVLILDEATEGLAPLIAREIWRICGVIRETGISSVIVDKNWKHVTQITDRNIILVKGEVVFEGSSAELHARPELLTQYLGV